MGIRKGWSEWKFCDSDSNSDSSSSSSSFSSSSSSSSTTTSPRTLKKHQRREEGQASLPQRADTAKHTRRRRARRRSRKGALVADLKGLPKETVVRHAEVSFDGTTLGRMRRVHLQVGLCRPRRVLSCFFCDIIKPQTLKRVKREDRNFLIPPLLLLLLHYYTP